MNRVDGSKINDFIEESNIYKPEAQSFWFALYVPSDFTQRYQN